jgi:HSP20 family protein
MDLGGMVMFGLTPYNSRRNLDVQRASDLWDPESWFDNFFNDFPTLYGSGSQMKVDIKENEKDYEIEAELPGVKKDEINIELRDDRLTISVQREEHDEEEKNNYIRKERRVSSMSRSFYVSDVKPEDVKAKFENGVLTLTLPKSEDEKKREHRIQIN